LDRSNRLTINELTLSGQLAARNALRYTPAGVPILTFSVAHQSRQSEAGADRDVGIEMACVAVETEAKTIAAAPLGIGLKLAGFLAPKGKHSRQVVLHVNEIEFLEGVSDAPTQQRP
jgi:primosomal replication protein N